jgi:hypothetical protein
MSSYDQAAYELAFKQLQETNHRIRVALNFIKSLQREDEARKGAGKKKISIKLHCIGIFIFLCQQ